MDHDQWMILIGFATGVLLTLGVVMTIAIWRRGRP
jgi:hypothetical protein